MKRMKRFFALCLTLVMVLSLAACGSKEEKPAEKPADKPAASAPADSADKKNYTIRIGTAFNDGHYLVNGYEAFEEYVEKESGGRIQVDIFANSSLVTGDVDGMDLVSSNSIQLGNSDFTLIGTIANDKRWESTSIPYYYGGDPEKLYDIIDNSEAWQKLYDETAEKTNIKVVGLVNGGSVSVSNNKRSIEKLEDFKGLRIRTPESAPYTAPIAAWGGNPTPMAFGEIYTSLQQGVIDGVMTGKSTIAEFKFTDLCKYHIDADVFLLAYGFAMNNDFYNSLDAEAQQIVDGGIEVLLKVAREGEVEFRNSLDDIYAERGVTVVKPEGQLLEDLKSVLADYAEERKAEIPDFIAEVQKDIDRVYG